MPETAHQKIEKLAAEFVERLRAIAVDEVIRSVKGEASGRSTRPSRAAANGDGRGAKRSAGELEELQDRVVATLKSKPNLRVEELNRELGVESGVLALPIKKLLATKRLKAAGTRRSTKYAVAGGANGGRSAKKAKKGKRARK